MEDKHIKIISDNMERLILLVDHNIMIKELQDMNIVTDLMVQTIKTTRGFGAEDKDKNRLLFRKLIRQGPDVFQKILDIFKRNNFDDAVKLLSPKHTAFLSTLHKEPQPGPSITASTSSSNLQPCTTRKLEPFTTDTSFQFIPALKLKRAAAGDSFSGCYCWLKMESYSMASEPRGVFFFVNIINFKSKPRIGADKDRENLVTLFRELGFIIFYYEDLTKSECFHLLEELVRSDYLTRVDSFVCCIQTHGNLIDSHTRMEFIDGSHALTEDITNMFTNTRCPSLKNKPKVFFFPFCRNRPAEDKTIKADSGENISQRKMASNVPPLSDVLICYGTVPGFKTHRDTESGTWYINELCKLFAEHACDTHIENLIKMIGLSVGSNTMTIQNSGTTQVTSFVNLGFNKLMFFNPKKCHKLSYKILNKLGFKP